MINLSLYSNNGSGTTHTDLSYISSIAITFGSGVTISSAVSPALFSGVTSSKGYLNLKLGTSGVTLGKYESKLIVYDSVNTNGVVWGIIPTVVK